MGVMGLAGCEIWYLLTLLLGKPVMGRGIPDAKVQHG